RLMTYRKYLRLVERRGHMRELIEALLEADAHDKAFFGTRTALDTLAKRVTTPTSIVSVQADEENALFSLAVEDRSNGYSRHHTISLDFVTAPDYRTLLNSYREIRDIRPPMTVLATGAVIEQESDESDGGAGLQAGQAEVRLKPDATKKIAVREPEMKIASLDDLIEYFINAGKRGVAINRYKGLGEMNPDQLWSTTMNPEVRTLLQVRAEDHTEADQMFTTPMGDQVEPRRKFIEDNALDVRNLDI